MVHHAPLGIGEQQSGGGIHARFQEVLLTQGVVRLLALTDAG
jgi:hypothetical protein